MSDADGDSTMHSSPELDTADDDMFPDEAGPSTPRNTASYALDPASELSPPNSQGPSNVPRDEGFSSGILNANGKRVYSSAVTSAGGEALHQDAESGYQWSKQEEQPGWDWKNPRAREEEMRALDTIIDKGLQIKLRYGDPLDPNVLPKTKR